MVRNGHILSAPHFVTQTARAPTSSPSWSEAWSDFDLASALARAIGKPCRVANDADVQGARRGGGQGF